MSAQLAGNASKLLIAALDDAAAPRAARLRAAPQCALERLVALFANFREQSVRKNVAVAIAKAVREPAAMARVRELRGMEMLVQIGNSLL